MRKLVDKRPVLSIVFPEGLVDDSSIRSVHSLLLDLVVPYRKQGRTNLYVPAEHELYGLFSMGNSTALDSLREFIDSSILNPRAIVELRTRSDIGEGTAVTVIERTTGSFARVVLPWAPPPRWFLPRLIIDKEWDVAVLDDDPSIHYLWKCRLSRYLHEQVENVQFFSAPHEFRDWAQRSRDRKKLCLVDFELGERELTGLQVVTEQCVESETCLVTSRAEEPFLQNACGERKIRLLPKTMLPHVPILVY